MDGAARETAGITTRLVIAYVRGLLGDDGVRRCLERAGETRPVARLEDEATWSSYDAKIRLFAAAAATLGDPQAARRIGESVIHEQVGGTIKLIVTTLGSPGGVLRSVARANAKFSTVATMRASEVGRNRAVVSYRLHDGYTPSRFDCDYTTGLLSQVPALFDLPPAAIVHHSCQVDGADECVYELHWRPRSQFSFGRRTRIPQRVREQGLQQRLESLQETALALTTTTDLDELLRLVASRASSAARGQRYLLAVTIDGERAPRIHGEGFTETELHRLGRLLLRGGAEIAPPATGTGVDVAVADVAARGHLYGRLAAFSAPGHELFPEEHDALRAYANLAAAALDSAASLAVARQRRRTAEALLQLAGSLAAIQDTDGIARAVARAVPEVTGADRSSILLWDEGAEVLRVAALHGWTREETAHVRRLIIGHDDTPALAAMLEDPTPRIFRPDDGDRFVHQELAAYDSRQVCVCPVVHAGEFLGVVIANWSPAAPLPRSDDETVDALAGVGHHMATALATVRLLQRERHRAAHDPLTGLPNRALFEDRLDDALRDLPRASEGFAVVFADLDRFKNVNDSLGHPAGDALLEQVAARLVAALRHGDTVSRTGGDEFTMLARRVSNPNDLAVIVERVRDALAPPFRIGDTELHASMSIGAALAPRDGRTRAELLRKADAAMYMAKRDGTGTLLWDPRLRDHGDPLRAERDLRRALTEREIVPAYQPQIELATGQVTGLEALARWRHPRRGLLSPAEFLHTAESTGLIVDLDLAILEAACRDGHRWLDEGICPDRIAVNLSGRTLLSPRLLPTLRRLLAETGYPARRLELELTETHLIRDLEQARRVSEAITGLGCTVAIDDTGTGYSTLGTLLQLPVARLKIDRSYVAGLEADERDQRVVNAILTLAASLDQQVVAEGVEVPAQADYLTRRGCQEAQGYLYARPILSELVPDLLAAHARPAGLAHGAGR